MVSDIVIEEMTSSDIDGIYEVEVSSFSKPWSKRSFEKELTNSVATYLVAKIDNRLIGYIGVWQVLDEGHITNVAVHKDYRGKKIGNKLVRDMVMLCEEKGITAMTLEVRVSNVVAQNLYKKYGFKSVGIRKGYYEDKEDAMIMWNDMKEV